MTDLLRRFPGFPRPVYSMDTGGGGGGGDDSFEEDDLGEGSEDDSLDFLGGDDDDDDENDEFDGDDSLDGGNITDDAASILADLFKAPTGNGTGTQNQGGAGDGTGKEPTPKEVQDQLVAQLNQGFDALTLPEDLIPENFNPSDPKELRTVLNNVQKQSARNAVALMFGPVQVALGRMAIDLRKEMRQNASSTVTESQTRALLEAHVPAYNSPKSRPIVEMLLQQAKQRYPGDPRAQVKATRKAAVAMGLRTGSSAPRGNSRTGGTNQSERNTLDLYAGNPNKPTRQGKKPANSAQKALMRLLKAAGG